MGNSFRVKTKYFLSALLAVIFVVCLSGCYTSGPRPAPKNSGMSEQEIKQRESDLIQFKNLRPFKFAVLGIVKPQNDNESTLETILDEANMLSDCKNSTVVYIRAVHYIYPKSEGGGNEWSLFVEKADFKTNTMQVLSSCTMVPMDSNIAKYEKAVQINEPKPDIKLGMIDYEKEEKKPVKIIEIKDDHWVKLIYTVQEINRTERLYNMEK